MDTLFFGGGTPTHLMPEDLKKLFNVVGRWFPPAAGGELSIEANPADLAAKGSGVFGEQRLSIGESLLSPKTPVPAAGRCEVLAAAGVYGIVTSVVSERTREIGLRRSLGAPDAAIAGLVARQVATLTAIGLAAGLAGASAGTRALQAFTYDTSGAEPWRLAAVALTLTLTAALACIRPLLRALRVDPATALRTS